MILFLAILLIVLWLLGMVTTTTLGGWLHILLVVAIVFLLIRVIRGQPVEAGGAVYPTSAIFAFWNSAPESSSASDVAAVAPSDQGLVFRPRRLMTHAATLLPSKAVDDA